MITVRSTPGTNPRSDNNFFSGVIYLFSYLACGPLRYRGLFLALMLIFSGLLEVAFLFLLSRVISGASINGDGISLAVVLLAISVFNGALSICINIFASNLSVRLACSFLRDYIERVAQFPWLKVSNSSSIVLLEYERATFCFFYPVLQLVAKATIIVFIFSYLLVTYGSQFLLIAIVTFLVAAFAYYLMRNFLRHLSLKKSSGFNSMVDLVSYFESDKLSLISLGSISSFGDMLQNAATAYWSSSGKIVAIGQTPKYILESTLSLIVVCYIVFHSPQSNASGIDFFYIAARITVSIQTLLAYSFALKSNANAVSEVAMSLSHESHGAIAVLPAITTAYNTANEFKRGSFYICQSLPQDLILECAFRGITTITGRSGVGKSTLLANLSQYDSTIDYGFSYDRLPLKGNHSLVTQHNSFFPGNLESNIEFYRYQLDLDLFYRLLNQLSILSAVTDSSNLTSLSGGEQARLWFCIAASSDKQICMLDEPSAGLDLESSLSMHDAMRSISNYKNISFLLISHDRQMIESSDIVHSLG